MATASRIIMRGVPLVDRKALEAALSYARGEGASSALDAGDGPIFEASEAMQNGDYSGPQDGNSFLLMELASGKPGVSVFVDDVSAVETPIQEVRRHFSRIGQENSLDDTEPAPWEIQTSFAPPGVTPLGAVLDMVQGGLSANGLDQSIKPANEAWY